MWRYSAGISLLYRPNHVDGSKYIPQQSIQEADRPIVKLESRLHHTYLVAQP